MTGEGQAKPASFWCRRVDGVFGELVAVEGDATGMAEGYTSSRSGGSPAGSSDSD
jgi:hypothetical protein